MVKVFGIFLLIAVMCLSLAIAMDLMMGLNVAVTLYRLGNPFWMMDTPEKIVMIAFLSLPLIQEIRFLVNKHRMVGKS